MGLWDVVKRSPLGRVISTAGDVISDGADAVGDAASDATDFAKPYVSNAIDVLSGRADRRFSAGEADKNRQWQEEMANSEVSRRREDLLNAGVNPLLAGQDGASTPSGSMAHGSNMASSAQGLMDRGLGLMGALTNIRKQESEAKVNEASAFKLTTDAGDTLATQSGRVDQLVKGLEEIQARIASHGADVQLKGAQTSTERERTHLTVSQRNERDAATREIGQRIAKLKHETSSAKSQADRDALAAEFAASLGGDIQRWSDAIGLKGRDITDMVGIVGVLGKLFKTNRVKGGD